MNTIIKTSYYEALIAITGDPFVDIGGYVIKNLITQEAYKDKSILELIESVAKIYVNNWGGKLHAFFLNSTITQAAFKGDKKIQATLAFYKGLIEETAPSQLGYCRITGQKTKLFPAGRDNYILSGSGTFINFHHSYEDGLYVSKEALIRTFFVPFGLIQLGDKIALINSNNDKVTEFFTYQNCYKNQQELGSCISEGVLRSDFNSPANALFDFATQCINNGRQVAYSEEIEQYNIMLNLYLFTNFGAKPEVVLYHLSADLFKFYAYCLSHGNRL